MNSVWTSTAILPHFPPLDHDLKTDVLIIGGGFAGLLCAYMLVQAGIDCALVEADRLCGKVSGNTTSKITSQHGLIYHKLIRRYGLETAKLYLEANEQALAQYRTLCREIDCDFEERDAFVYSIDQPEKIDRELDALARIGFPGKFAGKLPLPFSVAGAVRFEHQAQFHPLKFIRHIVSGLNIYEHTAVRGFDGSAMVTDRGRIRASQIIVATHFPFLNKHGAYFLKLYQHRSYVLAVDNGPDLNGMYVDERSDGLSFRNYNGLLLLGGGGHRTGKPGGGWAEQASLAQLHYPGSREKFRWATQDCMTLDGIPYIGRYSKRTPNLYVATGFNKWGMTSSMAAATMLRDLVLDRDTPYADLFSPARRMLWPQLAANAGETAANLLSFSKPRCPHLGCALKWNPQEHTWDCPCHGSRFAADGELLENPATGNLKQPPEEERPG